MRAGIFFLNNLFVSFDCVIYDLDMIFCSTSVFKRSVSFCDSAEHQLPDFNVSVACDCVDLSAFVPPALQIRQAETDVLNLYDYFLRYFNEN